MNIYRLETGFLIAGGTANISTLKINGGLCRQFFIRTESVNTVFRASLLDKNSINVLNYGYHTQEINDTGSEGALPFPMLGVYTLRISSASLATTCSLNLVVQE